MKLSLLVSIFLNVSITSSSVGSFPYSNLQRSTMNSFASSYESYPSLFASYFVNAASTFYHIKSVRFTPTFVFFSWARTCRILFSSDLSFVIDFINSWHDAFRRPHSFRAASPSFLAMKVLMLYLKDSAFFSYNSILIFNCFALPIHSPRLLIGDYD